MLEYLLRNPHRVVSKTELLDHVWDAAEDTDPNAVEVYIGYLRRKLGRRRAADRPRRRLPAGSVSPRTPGHRSRPGVGGPPGSACGPG